MSRWPLLRAGLSAYVDGPQSATLLARLHDIRPELSLYADATTLVDKLAAQEAPERNELVVAMISAWRQDSTLRRLTAAILALGLWKDLNFIYQYEAQNWESTIEEFEALFIFHFLRAINSSDVERAPDPGQSLVRAARRDARHALVRTRQLEARDLLLGQVLLSTASGDLVPFNQIPERDLRVTLSRLMRSEDIDLLVEVFLNDRPRDWLVERFRKSSSQINFRIYRILSRLRRLA
jgi:hypothetical protein